jgi:hypothetical protein
MATAPATASELQALRTFRARLPPADRDTIDDNALLRYHTLLHHSIIHYSLMIYDNCFSLMTMNILYLSNSVLRARKMDIAESLKMLASIKEFRLEYKCDNIVDLADPLEPIYQHMCPHGFHNFSKAGCPIYVERTGLIRYSLTFIPYHFI